MNKLLTIGSLGLAGLTTGLIVAGAPTSFAGGTDDVAAVRTVDDRGHDHRHDRGHDHGRHHGERGDDHGRHHGNHHGHHGERGDDHGGDRR